MSGLEGLAGTPQRVASPATAGGSGPPPVGGNNLDDLMGLSNGSGGGGFGQSNGMSNEDVLGGFAALDMNAESQPPPAGQQLHDGGKKTNEDLLGLF